VVDRIRPDELHELASSWGFAVDDAEAEQLLTIADAVFQAFDLLESQKPVRVAPVDAIRDVGRPPAEGEDPLNAIVRFCRVRADGVEGVLSGTRVAVKDSVAVAGIPLTGGSRILQGFVPTEDSVVADRMLRAGAEFVAITNMDDLAFSGGGESSWYGPTLNPWDHGRTAGGSSGGSAAALYYDGIDVSIGADQGGSIRAPASWCGIVGLKPTHGLVPYSGIAGIDQTFDHCGPMGRSSADVAALLQAIAGPHDSDPRQRGVRVADYVAAVAEAPDSLEGIRLGIVADAFGEGAGVEPETADATMAVVERLRGLGAETVDVLLPEHLQAGGIAFIGFVEGMTNLMESGGNGYSWPGRYWEALAPALQKGLRDHAGELSAQMKVTLVAGRWLRARYAGALYAKGQNLRPWLRAAYDRALDGVDALVLPTTPWRAHELGSAVPLAERVLRGWANLSNTYPTDMTGHPAISLPLAEAGGLPVGVMLVGRHYDDARLLATAAVCERALGWAPVADA
jgi:amidase